MSKPMTWRSRGHWLVIVLLLLTLVVWSPVAAAQEGDGVLTNADVFVTVQRAANLRRGPGTLWEAITVLPAGTTLRATGRVANWVQVIYATDAGGEPVYGWVWRNVLIWTGDLNSLPLDGIEPETFLRVQGYTLTLTPEMQIYRNTIMGIGERVIEPLPCTEVEYTGRLGSGSVYWMQFWCDGAYYWVGSHNFFKAVSPTDSVFYAPISANSFTYRYGRMVVELRNTGYTVARRIDTMSSIWNSLAGGRQVSCSNKPVEVPTPDINTEDLNVVTEFLAPIRALQSALDHTNAAIGLFDEVCAHIAEQPLVDPQMVSDAQTHLAEARTYLYLAQQFYFPLANRDPYAGGANESSTLE